MKTESSGFGRKAWSWASAASVASRRDALEEGILCVVREHGYSPTSIGTLASLDLKADEEGLLEVANRHGWDSAFFTAEELAGVKGLANPSAVVQECVGTPGVAEPAALLAAGADRLLVEKQVVASPLSPKRMTFALARRSDYQERASGPGAGRVIFYRRRPGRSRFAHGQGRSRDPAGPMSSSTPARWFPKRSRGEPPLGQPCTTRRHLTLEEVATILIDAVRAGKRVVRLQSGDLSLYSAIQEQMTVLDEAGVPFDMIPGISAYQAAAAALKTELTLPEVAQTIILTRGEGTTKMPGSRVARLSGGTPGDALHLPERPVGARRSRNSSRPPTHRTRPPRSSIAFRGRMRRSS